MMGFDRFLLANTIINFVQHLSKKGKVHDGVEDWLGKHNRKLELLRTFTSFVSAIASTLVLLKVFHII